MNLFIDVFSGIIDVDVALPAFLNMTLQQLRRGTIPIPFIDACLDIPTYLNLRILTSLLTDQCEVRLVYVTCLLKFLDGYIVRSSSHRHLKNSKQSRVIILIELVNMREPYG